MADFLNSDSDSDDYSDEYGGSDTSPLNDYPSQTGVPGKKWDAFQAIPPEVDSGSMAAMVWVRRFEKLMLILAYVLTFFIIFTAAVVGKGVTFFMIAQISPREKRVLPYCNADRHIPDTTKTYEVQRDRTPAYLEQLELEQVAWVWCLIFAFCTPEVMTLLRAMRVVLFKHWFLPKFREFVFVLLMETLHTVGMAVLIFLALPQLDTTHALALSNCLAVVPGILLAMSRPEKEKNKWIKTPLDVIAILCQLSGALIWPILQWVDNSKSDLKFAWAIPVGLILASFGWWECFIHEDSKVPFVRWMWRVKDTMNNKTRYFTYLWISVLKIIIFFATTWVIVSFNGILQKGKPFNLFSKFTPSFHSHAFNVTEIMDTVVGDGSAGQYAYEDRLEAILYTIRNAPQDVLWIQIGCTYGAYIFSKFACKVQIQGFSYAVPLCSIVPLCITLLLAGCGARADNTCAFHDSVPDYLFFECPSVGDYFDYLWQEQMWLWALWLVSQMWITLHIWFPKSRRLAATEQIFGSPMYNSIFIDQSLVLNRRKDGENDVDFEDLRDDFQNQRMNKFYDNYVDEHYEPTGVIGGVNNKKNIRPSDRITKIYGCATMWHENKAEMLEMLKSVFRIDMDYSARRLAQKYLQVVDPDYYEWETHMFFDDAFELGNNDEEQQVVNMFVKLLVRSIDEAGSFVHCRNIKVKPPKRYPTPYGGRLVWTLPGKTRIVCHLKDKDKIRHKKRWSQCMYMYYLLGFKLMELPISDERKEVMAENTYLLALDGDIDFQPESITRLVDLMKKNKNLGAACGRIHPTGSGFMQWYQRFEYAIGHWLQKATEHVMGCVLCSPGCFSLFRAKALMDDNVMKMYTTKSEAARDFVQFDQGEDRWLCTLLLQRGWRVEYSAASDAFTACPEGFNEFFNQRRRWMPSTIANIFDVLSDYKNVTRVNEDISFFYILYQMMMMLGTVIGPGTIFLMLVGAFTAAFGLSNWDSFLLNLVPILLFMLACFLLNTKIQLVFAQILSASYALVMMAVLVGIMLQIKEDGILAPTTLSIFLVGGSFILSAILHPQEFWCLPYGIIYYVTIPSMYLLLVIYSIFNMNDVSWGTRDVPKKVTKADLEEERKKEEEAKKAMEKQKKKNDGGLLSFLYQQSGKQEKGGMEFNLANLCKCMLFVQEDPNDSKKQLVQIATSMEEVTGRLSRIEGTIGGGGGGRNALDMRRRSSYGRRATRGSVMGISAPLNEAADDASSVDTDPNLAGGNDPESDDESNENKVERDDLVNPYWIEDRDLRNGPIDFLPGVEVQFFKDLIEKYLEPMLKDDEKEKRQAGELKTLRNQMVFSFFMLNAIFVLVVFLLQQKKDLLFIRWPFGAKANITFVTTNNENPQVEIVYSYLELEPIGLIFVVFFAVVLVIQVIGMLFHRWGTISQIISTTKLPFCEKKAKDTTDKGDLNKQALAIVNELQKEAKESDETKYAQGAVGRRTTVANLMLAQNMKKKEETADLEKRFRNRLQSIRFEDIEQSDNAALRRLSTRRGTLTELQIRRDTFFEGERRRSTVQFDTMTRRMSMDPGIANESLDSDYDDEFSGSYSVGSQHLADVSDEEETGF